MMTAADWISDRRALIDAATEEPWVWEPPSGMDWPDGDQSLIAPAARDEGGEGVRVLYGWGYDASGIKARDEDRAAIADARTSLPAALDALEAVLEKHEFYCEGCDTSQPERCHPECRTCWEPWPCDTYAAITTALGIEVQS